MMSARFLPEAALSRAGCALGRWLHRLARRLIELQCAGGGQRYPSRLPIRLLQLSADQGNPRAMGELGEWLFQDGACRADKRNGLEYLRRAAKLGDAAAQYRLGEAHLSDSPLLKTDRQQARHWLALAADAGEPRAQQRLAQLAQRLP